jgi:outer membrane receptor protein involved in Fe transport
VNVLKTTCVISVYGQSRLIRRFNALLLMSVCSAYAAVSHDGSIQTLDTVDVTGTADDLVGVADSATQGTVVAEQIEGRPLLRPGELLETIPGLIVTRHSGSGKANQYFLRGFNLDHGIDFSAAGSAWVRYFGPRPLIEDNSVRSSSSTIINLATGLKLSRQVQLSLELLNLFDAKVADIAYYYASQLQGEAAPVNDIHTHPAEPFTARVGLRINF